MKKYFMAALVAASVLLAFTRQTAAPLLAERQQTLFVVNETRYDLIINLWVNRDAQREWLPFYKTSDEWEIAPLIARIPSRSFAATRVDKYACFIDATAVANGVIFVATLDVCRGPAVWVIRTRRRNA